MPNQTFRIHLDQFGAIQGDACDVVVNAKLQEGRVTTTRAYGREVGIIPLKRVVAAQGPEHKWEYWVALLDGKKLVIKSFL